MVRLIDFRLDYPEDQERSSGTARIPKGQLEAIKKFLETDEAHDLGYTSISSFIEDAVRRRLEYYKYHFEDHQDDVE